MTAERLISSFELPSTSWSAVDERGQVRLVRDVEEDGADADEEADHVELPERQRVEAYASGIDAEQRCPAEIADDEDRLSLHPVDPDPAGIANSMKGRNSITTSADTANALASSTRIGDER